MTAAFPLSPSQQLVWLHEELFPDSRAYNFTATIDFNGPLDADALIASMGDLIGRHPGLRLQLVPDTFPAQQCIQPDCTPDLRRVDLAAHPQQAAEFDRIRRAHHTEGFRLDSAPLLRWCLVRCAEDHHRLIHTEHHLIHDGQSFAIILRDLFTFYRARVNGEPARLPEPGSYAEHALHANQISESHWRSAIEHWQTALADADLTAPCPPTGGPEQLDGGQYRLAITAPIAQALRDRAKQDGHTPFTVLMALFAAIVRRESGRDNFVVGTAAGARPPGFDNCVGMFVNTLPVPLQLHADRPAAALVDDVTDTLVDALRFQDVPISQLTNQLAMHSASGLDNPLFSLLFSANDAPLPTIDLGELEVLIESGYNSGTSRFHLDPVFLPDDRRMVTPRTRPAGMTLIWDYRLDPFNHEQVTTLAHTHLDLLSSYLADPTKPLCTL